MSDGPVPAGAVTGLLAAWTAGDRSALDRLLPSTSQTRWLNRAQLFGIAAQPMRRILIDHARKHAYAKRCGGAPRAPLDEARVVSAMGGRIHPLRRSVAE